jgi:hypothetical protein
MLVATLCVIVLAVAAGSAIGAAKLVSATSAEGRSITAVRTASVRPSSQLRQQATSMCRAQRRR